MPFPLLCTSLLLSDHRVTNSWLQLTLTPRRKGACALLNDGPILGWQHSRRVEIFLWWWDSETKSEFHGCLIVWLQPRWGRQRKGRGSIFTGHTLSDFLYTCNHVSLSWSLINKSVVHLEKRSSGLFDEMKHERTWGANDWNPFGKRCVSYFILLLN